MKTLNDLKIQLYADGADKAGILDLYAKPYIKGLTTNPSLMKKAGIKDYEAFAKDILKTAGIPETKKGSELTAEEEQKIRSLSEAYLIEGELRREIGNNIKRLKDIRSLRGDRHSKGLPVRGQRTHTNARTRKGPRKGTVAGKKKATGKT